MQIDVSTLVGVAGTIVGLFGVVITWRTYIRDRAELKIQLRVCDEKGTWGSIIDNKDHLLVKALNVGRQPLVFDEVKIILATPFRFWFKRPSYDPHRYMDHFGGLMGGGSFGEPRKIEPGFEFVMILDLSGDVLVGHHIISKVQIPDSVGNIYEPTWFEIFLLKRSIKNQYPEWRKKLSFAIDAAKKKSSIVKKNDQKQSTDNEPINEQKNTLKCKLTRTTKGAAGLLRPVMPEEKMLL